jgi:hypothetical protein
VKFNFGGDLLLDKKWALLFSSLGISMLCGVSVAISFGSVKMALLFTLGFFVVTAVGFVVKARARQKQ